MDPYNEFFTRPNLKLVDVFDSPDLVSAIRSESSSFFKYLSQEPVITELAEWCITSKFVSNPKYNKYSIIAVSIFLSTSTNIFDFVLSSEAFAETLHHFLESDDSLNSKFCGHFYRIISTQIRWGTPALFKLYADTQKLLFNRIQMSAIRELIELIILTSAYETLNTRQVLSDLAEISSSNGEFSYDAETCLINIFSSLTVDSDIFINFCQPSFISSMIKAAILCSSPCMAHDILKMIISISKIHQESIILDDEQKKNLLITADNITNLSVTAFPLLLSKENMLSIVDVFSLFFHEKAHPMLHDHVCSVLDEVSCEVVNEIASIPNFLQNLIDCFGTQKWCPHMFKIALTFSSVEVAGNSLRSKNWCSFIRNKFLPIINLIDNGYGGVMSMTNFASDSFESNIIFYNTDFNSNNNGFIQYWDEEEEESIEYPVIDNATSPPKTVNDDDCSDELEIQI